MNNFRMWCTCVDWPENDVDAEGGLIDLIDQCQQITRRTFMKRANKADLAELELNLGYDKHYKQGLTMSADWHVGYFKSKHHGATVYGVQHSRIEHVFKQGGY